MEWGLRGTCPSLFVRESNFTVVNLTSLRKGVPVYTTREHDTKSSDTDCHYVRQVDFFTVLQEGSQLKGPVHGGGPGSVPDALHEDSGKVRADVYG